MTTMTTSTVRRLTASVLVFLAVATALTPTGGCGRGSTDDDGTIRLQVWVSYNNEELPVFEEITRQFVSAWNAAHADRPIAIKPSQVPFGGLLPKLKTACQTHTTPDICRVDCAHVVPLAFGHAVVALDELEPFKQHYRSLDEVRKEYVEAAIDSNVVRVKRDGSWVTHLYGLPDVTNCVCLFRNLAIFREAADELRAVGLSPDRAPRTWDELIAYGKVLSNPEKKIYAFAMDNSLWWTLPFFNCWGANFLDVQDGRLTCRLDDDDAVRALQFKVDLYQRRYDVAGRSVRIEAGAWIPGAIAKDTGFINGKYAMIMTGPWNVKNFREAGIQFDVNMIPEGPDGSSSNVGGTNLVVFKSCRHPDIAYEYIKHVTSTASQALWCNKLSQIPTVHAAFGQVDTDGKPDLFTFFRQIVKAKARPQVPNYEQLEEIINPEMELALKGDKTAQQALSSAVERINREVLRPINDAR